MTTMNQQVESLSKDTKIIFKKPNRNSGQVAQLVRVAGWYAKVVGSIPGQGTYKNQPANAQISGTTNQCFFLSSPPSSLSLKSINFKKRVTAIKNLLQGLKMSKEEWISLVLDQ